MDDEMCRCCLTTNAPLTNKSMDVYAGEWIPHVNKVAYCFADFKVETHSNFELCNKCSEALNGAYYFKKTMFKTNAKLKTYRPQTSAVIKEETSRRTERPPCDNETIVKLEIFEQSSSDDDDDERIEIKVEPCADHNATTLTDEPTDPRIQQPRIKPYRCEQCTKSFVQKNHLQQHVRIHTGEKPYRCAHCDKAFVQKNHLQQHTRTHTGEKPFRCERCSKSFVQQSHLIIHTRIHTGEKPFKCEHCDKSFTSKRNVITHTRIHTGEKPHRCERCDKSFVQQCHLINHMSIHTGDKPYQCEHCNKTFARNDAFKQHVRTHAMRPYDGTVK